MKLFVFPGNIEPEILAAGAEDVPYARTAVFGNLVNECHGILGALLGAPDAEVLSFTASGTGAAEALLANWGPRWKSIVLLHSGTFGERWLDMSRRLGLDACGHRIEPGTDPDWHRIQEVLDRRKPDAVVAVHHETSNGELLDLPRLGALCADREIHLVVDAIGSFLADDFAMESSGVAAAFVSSQKGLCLPPGLAFLAVRPSLGDPADSPATCYFDARTHRDSFLRGQPPWSPAAQIYRQLRLRLATIQAAGGSAARVQAVAAKARHFRSQAARLAGWVGFPANPSNCLTALRFERPAGPMVAALAADGWFVMPSADPRLVRIAHLGETTLEDHDELLDRLRHLAAGLDLAGAAPRAR